MLHFVDFLSGHMNFYILPHTTINLLRNHPFKTLAFFRGRGVKNLPNLPTDSSKKTANGRGIGVKNREKFANVLNGWSLIRNDP